MSETLVVSDDQAPKIFSSLEDRAPAVAFGEKFITIHGVEEQFGHTTLALRKVEEGYAVPGNTVPRICAALGKCAADSCGLAERLMSNDDRRAEDCAAANTEVLFDGKPGFVLTPTEGENPAKVVFLKDGSEAYDDVNVLDEAGNPVRLFRKVKQASSFVVSEHDPIVRENPQGIFLAMNGADSSFGVATLEVDETRYAVAFCSSRPNLGDRGPDYQILRLAIEGILDNAGLEGQARADALQNLQVQIDIGYSASLENFAHDVRVPKAGTPYADKLVAKYGLTDASELTPKQVMEDQYPGSLSHDEVYPHSNVELGIDEPYREGGCPGDGELCHIHYPRITERTLRKQLEAMGIPDTNVLYDNSRAIDPASKDNDLASNRLFQLAGVPVAQTLRTAQGASVRFTQRAGTAV